MGCGSLPYPTNNFQINKYDNCRTNYESLDTLNIIDKIIELCKERITYGYNRIWALLRNSGINIAKKTVYKIMILLFHGSYIFLLL